MVRRFLLLFSSSSLSFVFFSFFSFPLVPLPLLGCVVLFGCVLFVVVVGVVVVGVVVFVASFSLPASCVLHWVHVILPVFMCSSVPS